MTAPKWTRYAQLPRKGWLAMECNVDKRTVAEHPESDPSSYEQGQAWVRNDHAAELGKASMALSRVEQLRDDLRGAMTAGDIMLTVAEIGEHQKVLGGALELFQTVADVELPTTLEELEHFVAELSQWL